MMLTTCIWLTTKVNEDFSERPFEKRLGCGGLPRKLLAEQESTKNNWLHVKENFKSGGIAVFGLFKIPWAKRTASNS
jgi:hypothetical protein